MQINFKYLHYHFNICVVLIANIVFKEVLASQPYEDFALSAGNLCEYIDRYQTNNKGDMNFCSFTPYFTTHYDIPFIENFLISPEVGLTLPKSGPDSDLNYMGLMLLLNAKYSALSNNLQLLLGPGLYFTRIAPKGGTAVLNNGNSTSTFTIPNEVIFTRNFIINLGVDYKFLPQWSVGAHTYIFNLLEKEDRAFSFGINGSYHFGDIL